MDRTRAGCLVLGLSVAGCASEPRPPSVEPTAARSSRPVAVEAHPAPAPAAPAMASPVLARPAIDLDTAGREYAHGQEGHRCWTEANAESCRRLGMMDLGHAGFAVDLAAAELALERGCKLGSAVACDTLAFEYLQGTRFAKNRARAAALSERGCALGSGSSCAQVGSDMAEGVLEPPAPEKAVGFMRQKCDSECAMCCEILGIWISKGYPLGPARPAEGRALIVKACRLGAAPACDDLNEGEPSR